MKIAIIGADGQLGTDLVKAGNAFDLLPLTHSDIEVADFDRCQRVLGKLQPEVIINTAAFHQTDLAEERYEEAFKVNAFGARNVALACKEIGAFLVHMSTDYVFHGDQKKPYTEEDSPCPTMAYGISKLAGEQFVRYILGKRRMIVRSSGLFGLRGSKAKGGKNFIENVLEWSKTRDEVRVVNDQRFSPTYTLDLARKIYHLLKQGVTGTIHITNTGDCTWFEFAKEILKTIGSLTPRLIPITTVESGAKSCRPNYSVLGHRCLQELGLDDLPRWEAALKDYLQARKVKSREFPAAIST